MADVFRWRRGATNPVVVPIATAQGVEVGDLIGLSTGYAYVSDEESYIDGLSISQYNFVANFCGVAAQRKAAGDTRPGHGGGLAGKVRVNTEGVYEFDAFATAYEVGQLVGPANASSGSALEPQKVVAVSDKVRAIGVVVEQKAATPTKVMVRIFGRKTTGRSVDET